MLALQRLAGNSAVRGLVLGDREPEEHGAEAAADAGRTPQPMPMSGQWGRPASPATTAERSTLFGRRRALQRYATTDSALANAASLVGLGGPAASALGAVSFESSGFSAAIGKPLAITRTGTDLSLASQTYTATGTVKAAGPATRVGDYEIGFLQTVYESNRNFYYEPPGHKQGFFARLVPALFSVRKKVSDTLKTQPVRDGDTGKKPWYGMETVDQFAKAASSTKSSTMDDTPSTSQPWKIGSPPDEQQLVKTDGMDRFRSWLAVKHKAQRAVIPLEYADWQVDYGTSVTFNKAAPASSVVTPTTSAGGKVTARGEGSGGKWPLHDDPTANDEATDVTTRW